jgi:hypothetical protein
VTFVGFGAVAGDQFLAGGAFDQDGHEVAYRVAVECPVASVPGGFDDLGGQFGELLAQAV